MGEPLNFVPGGERLFKSFLRELLIILCIRGREASSRWALRMALDYLLQMRGGGGGIGARMHHMMSLA